MTNKTLYRLLIVLFLGCFFSVTPIHISNAQPGLPFLRLSIDARGAAAGSAYVSAGKGLGAIQWNPAGIVLSQRNEIAVSHIRGFGGTDSEFFGILWKRKKNQAFAVSFFSNNIGGIEYRTKPTVNPEGIISAHDVYAGLSYATQIKTGIHFGATIKYLFQKIYTATASGVSGDIGIRYNPISQRYSAGFVIKNIGKMGALMSEQPKMPALIQLGASFIQPLDSNKRHIFEFSGEIEKIFNSNNHLYFGLEYGFSAQYYIRSGYITGFETGRFTAGAGISIRKYSFDYAYLPNVTTFGNHHIMTFRLLF